ncbi:MAG: hypothetical protein QXV84_04510 [Conexivisphaerales archaeon]
MKSIIASATLLLVLATALIATPAIAQSLPSTITGYWIITKAAAQSSGQAPTIIACGTFTISSIQAMQGGYQGTLSFSKQYPSSQIPIEIPGVNAPESIVLKVSSPIPGVLFVAFSGSSPVALSGSFTSPSSVPHPSIDPSSEGCHAFLQQEFLGLVHLPSQGTEGMTIYGEPINSI